MSYLLYGTSVSTLDALSDWDTANVININSAFANCLNLINIHGLMNWRVSNMISFAGLFRNDTNLKSLTGLENWDVRNIRDFSYMFGSILIDSLNAVADWDLLNGANLSRMFGKVRNLTTIEPLKNWKLPAATSLTEMFGNYKCWYSSLLETNVYIAEDNIHYIDDDFNTYTYAQVQDTTHPLELLEKDATYAENWDVQGTNKQAFGSEWSNVPSWN